MKICFLGTPIFVQVVKESLAKHFALVDSLKEADLGVIAAYGHILTKEELAAPKYGCINIHPSLLPKYRGPSPIQSAILNGDKISGITIIKMDEGVDHGPVLYQDTLELSISDNFDVLSKKMFLKSAEILPKVVTDFISGEIKPIAQNHSEATACGHLTRESGYFDINTPPLPKKLDGMIRAYYPWPGVWTIWEVKKGKEKVKKIVKFLPARNASPARNDVALSGEHSDARRQAFGHADGGQAGGSEGLLQMQGKKAIPFKDFLNGYPDFPLKGITFDKK